MNAEFMRMQKKNSSTLFEPALQEGETTVVLDDFKILELLAEGAQAKIYLVQKRNNQRYYAMKVLRKDKLIDHNSIQNVATERQILLKAEHPFLVKMFYGF